MNFNSSLFREESVETIRELFSASLGENVIRSLHLLRGGMFNTTYYVAYGSGGQEAVLRLGPVNRHLLMEFEQNLMQAEAYVCAVCESRRIPCGRILACDTTKKLIDRDFMIVKYVPSVVMCDAGLSKSGKERLNEELGRYLRRLHEVCGKSFGYVSQIKRGLVFDSWSGALIYETEDILKRLVNRKAFTEAEASGIRTLYEESRALLDEITTPHLLHTDLWEGNVLLDPEKTGVAAVIDGDRAVFGDIEFEFAAPWMDAPALLRGYGKNGTLNSEALRRRNLYLLYYTLLETYVGIGEYNNREQYEQGKYKALQLAGQLHDNVK